MTQMKHTTTGGTGNWTRDFSTSTTSNKLTGTSIGSNGSGTETYTYDNRGNIISGFNQLYELVYNAENRLEKLTDAAGIVTYYQYDSGDRRLRKMKDISIIMRRLRKYVGGWELYHR